MHVTDLKDPMSESLTPPIADLSNRVALVTGATSGRSYATAAGLGRRGATVLVHGRSRERPSKRCGCWRHRRE